MSRSDSINYNPHKMYGSVQETSIIVFRHEGVVRNAFEYKDPNSNPTNSLYDTLSYDYNGQCGMQTSRRPNVLKFWLMWKTKVK